MIKYLSTIISLVGLMLCYIPWVSAERFVIGVEDVSYFPHFDFNREDPGFAKALFDAFAADSDIEFQYVSLPIKRFDKWLVEENIDFKYPDNIRWQTHQPDLLKRIHFSDDIIYLMAGTLVLEKNQDMPREAFRNIGTLAGFTPTLWLDDITEGKINLVEDNSTTMLTQFLLKGIVDGLDLNPSVIRYSLKQIGSQENVVFNSKVPKQAFAYQLSTIKHPEVIATFNLWLANNQKAIETLRQRYGLADAYHKKPDQKP